MTDSFDTSESVSDRDAISLLINAWAYHRDRGNWDQLRDTFWPEGTISLSWFDGQHEQFVDASREMAKSERPVNQKHMVDQPFMLRIIVMN